MTDHNAHAWVEAWFPGYGWLAFDPTPGRGSLTGNYSASSTGFNAGDAAFAFGGPAGSKAKGGASELERLLQKERLAERQGAGGANADDGRPSVALAAPARRPRRRRRDRRRQGHPPTASVSDARSATARRRGAARARRLPRRPGGRRSAERDTRRAAAARARGARCRRSAVRRRARRGTLRAARDERGSGGAGAHGAASSAASDPARTRPHRTSPRSRRAPLSARVNPQVVVIAAGLGTRLRPLTERYAKPVLPIDGKPVIALLLRELAEAGFDAVTVVIGHLGDQVERLIGDGRGFGLAVRYARQASPDGSADAVLAAAPVAPYLVLGADKRFTPATSAGSPRRSPHPAPRARSPSRTGRAPSRSATGSSSACSERVSSRRRSGLSGRGLPAMSRRVPASHPSSSR